MLYLRAGTGSSRLCQLKSPSSCKSICFCSVLGWNQQFVHDILSETGEKRKRHNASTFESISHRCLLWADTDSYTILLAHIHSPVAQQPGNNDISRLSLSFLIACSTALSKLQRQDNFRISNHVSLPSRHTKLAELLAEVWPARACSSTFPQANSSESDQEEKAASESAQLAASSTRYIVHHSFGLQFSSICLLSFIFACAFSLLVTVPWKVTWACASALGKNSTSLLRQLIFLFAAI